MANLMNLFERIFLLILLPFHLLPSVRRKIVRKIPFDDILLRRIECHCTDYIEFLSYDLRISELCLF